jgi:general secretion pathway protein I
MAHRTPRGFTLLEVMVAIAILGLGLTTILSAQAGAFKSSTHARNLSVATGLARCKMTEVEEHLLELGFQETDESDSGPCCDGETSLAMRCTWKIEKPQLPEPKYGDLDLSSTLGGGSSGLGGLTSGLLGGSSGSGGPGDLGGLGALGALIGMGQSGMPGDGKIGDLSQMLAAANGGTPLTPPGAAGVDPYTGAPLLPGADPFAPSGPPDAGPSGLIAGADPTAGAAAAAPQGMASLFGMIMSIVYPDLKTMFEASTRRATVLVSWTEGVKEYSIDVVQWIASPQAGLPTDGDLDGGAGSPGGAVPGGFGSSPGGSGMPLRSGAGF